MEAVVSKQNLRFQPAPAYRLPVMGAVLQVRGVVWLKVTHSVTCVTPYSGPGPFVPEGEKPLKNQFGNEELIDGDDDVSEEVLRLGDFLETIALY